MRVKNESSFVGHSDEQWNWDDFFTAFSWQGLQETMAEELGFDGEIVLDIISELTDSCLKDTEELVLNEELEYNSIIQDAFNVSDDVNLILSDSKILNEGVAGLTEIEETFFGDINVSIHLNK